MFLCTNKSLYIVVNYSDCCIFIWYSYAQNESTPTHLNKNGHEIKNSGTEILSHSNSYNNTSIKSSSVFTDEDRELLAKLWRYLDPNSSLSGTNSPPPKPPLPNLCPLNIPFSDRRTDLVSSSNQSSQLSMNPFDDPNLLAYLCIIASTAQQKYPSNSSPIKKSSDCQKEFTLPTTRYVSMLILTKNKLNFTVVCLQFFVSSHLPYYA